MWLFDQKPNPRMFDQTSEFQQLTRNPRLNFTPFAFQNHLSIDSKSEFDRNFNNPESRMQDNQYYWNVDETQKKKQKKTEWLIKIEHESFEGKEWDFNTRRWCCRRNRNTSTWRIEKLMRKRLGRNGEQNWRWCRTIPAHSPSDFSPISIHHPKKMKMNKKPKFNSILFLGIS